MIKMKSGSQIHPTAIVAKGAEIDSSVTIGAYSVIGPNVKIGRDTRIFSHVVIDGWTTIGEHCEIFTGACLGFASQDLKDDGEEAYLKIGNDNIIREYVTIHRGSGEGKSTEIGDRNMFMVSSHVAHDCTVGHDVVMANLSALGGHSVIEDRAVIGGFAGVHQFVRVGKLAMVGGASKVVSDIAPFSICDGHPAKFYGINMVGLKRAGYAQGQMQVLKRASKILFASGLGLSHAIEQVKREYPGDKDVQYLVQFTEKCERGISRA